MIEIQQATARHAPEIAQLLTQLGYPTAPEVIPGRLADLEADGGTAVVARDGGGGVVGLAAAAEYATLHAGGRSAYITALVTSETARGQGVGRALVEAMEEWARGRGCVRLSVTSAERRTDAHAFYPKCGLPYTGRRFSKTLPTN
jgi:GNAT superfamily N-acetyltransferase